MAKQSGLGDNFYIGGYDLSGDVGSLGSISTPWTPLESTGINKLAIERNIGGLRSGHMEATTFFNKAAGQEHAILKTLPTTDTQVAYFRGTAVGNASAAMTAKQINYDGTRAADGGLTFNFTAESNSYGLEWGVQLTAGVATATVTDTTYASYDTGGSLSFGGQAYYQVFAFTGTDVQIKIQDSADNAAFATVASFTSTAISSAPQVQRLASTNTTTIRRYVRALVQTSTAFSNLQFAVTFVKNEIAGYVV